MQVVTTVEKSLLPCPFKMKKWLEEDRTRAISSSEIAGVFLHCSEIENHQKCKDLDRKKQCSYASQECWREADKLGSEYVG